MTSREEACLLNEAQEVERRIAAARPFPRSERAALLGEIRAAIGNEAELRDRSGPPGAALYRASFAKWRLMHAWLHRTPYRDRRPGSRPAQWREALAAFRELGDPELIDWLTLQIEVATNLENGVQDMRPRDPGPTWLVTLEHVANRKRKALALLHWAEDAERDGCYTVDSDWHARSSAILGREPAAYGRGSGGHEGIPWPDGEEN